MTYYLDTTSLRKVANKLDTLVDKDIYISSLSIFEIIAGITEKEYQKRKKYF